MKFTDMARECGLKRKGMYTMREVALATGVPYGTIRDERICGRIRAFVPAGRTRGYLFAPEWVDEWLEAGSEVESGW